MPVKPLYSFTSNAGITYHVQYDSDARAVFAETDPEDAVPETSVTFDELGMSPLATLHFECVGTTMVTVKPSIGYPFAYITNILNSRSCGYVPPGPPACHFIYLAPTIEHETSRGLKDGVITINVDLPGTPLEFSIDNRHWSANRTFSGLPPGNYRFYVRSTNRHCTMNRAFTIDAGPDLQEFPVPWEYKYCHVFKLVRNGIEYPVSEPIKWDGVNIKGKRDKEWHGWKSQYSDEILELEFDCDAGKEIIDAEYEDHGSDGVVEFKYGILWEGAEEIYFHGKLNLNTLKRYPGKVAASVESVRYNPMVETRIDTKVSMTSETTIDGKPIAPPPVIEFNLHSKKLARLYQIQNNNIYEAGTVSEAVQKLFVVPDTSEVQADEIETGYPMFLTSIKDAPYDSELFNWQIKYKGTYDFDIKFSLNLKYRMSMMAGTFTAQCYFMINDTKTPVGAPISGTMGKLWSLTPINYSYQGTHELQAGDEVYFFIEITHQFAFVYQLAITQTSMDITVKALEEAAESDCKGWFIGDAINHVIKTITEDETYVKSEFLSLENALQSRDGDGSLYIVTNGKQIRKFNTDNNPLKISAKDLLESVRALFCLGRGFETIAGVDVMRIERADYFYRDREILVIDECEGYYEEIAKDLLYNGYEVGYETYQDEGSNTLDDFNTKNEGVTPLKTNKLKIPIKSKLIASPYALEFSRRQQFADTATNSYQNDENGFIIAMQRAAAGYAPEKDESFDIVDGLISPESAYNIRISPKRILLNWAIWLRNIFHFKLDSDTITPTFVAQNGAMKTQLKVSDPHPIGDLNRDVIREDEPLQLVNYPVTDRIFRPEWIHFKARLTPDKIQLINRAMKGGDKEDRNYGWIAVKDPKGLYQAGFVYELDYNFFTEKATFKLMKLHRSPITPGEDCCAYWAENDCRILINGQKIIW